jgi:AraC family transcriptional regulator
MGTETITDLPKRIIQDEDRWLARPWVSSQVYSGVLAGRWSGAPRQVHEESTEISKTEHIIAIPLRTMGATIFASHKIVHSGRLSPGSVKIHLPSQPVRSIFQTAYDVLHLFVRNELLDECVEAGLGRSGTGQLAFPAGLLPADPLIDRLARAFIRAEDLGGAFGHCYAESVALAIIARVLSRCSNGAPANASSTSALAKWRLRRAVDFIEANLGESIGLAEMAASAGLSRMHFAAQFRAATGMRPHEYLLRRRIERAQHMLAVSTSPLVDVAFEVGFKSQSHFTTVFARFVGETPKGWRQRTRLLPAHACSGYPAKPDGQLETSERTRRIGTALDEGVKLRGSCAYNGTSELVSG